LGAALGGGFPAATSLHTRAVSPRTENGKLAPQTCIANELHWAWYNCNQGLC